MGKSRNKRRRKKGVTETLTHVLHKYERDRDVPRDVWERLVAQDASIGIERLREEAKARRKKQQNEAKQRNKAKKQNNASPSDESTEEDFKEEPLYKDEYDKLIYEDDTIVEEIRKREMMKIVKAEADKEANSKMSKEFTQGSNDAGYPSFEEYLFEISHDPYAEWNKRHYQTAVVLLEMENDRRREPNLRDLISSVIREKISNGQEYFTGAWAEVLTPDMKWSLERIVQVKKTEDNEFMYDVGKRKGLRAYEMRVPQVGLLRIYGYRPWIWQQWAFVKLEEKLRFQEHHYDDFETFNIPQYARNLWFEWLGKPENEDFRKHVNDRRIYCFQEDLFDHVMKPFYIMDDMRRGDGWDWDDENFSIFTYLSIFGSGFTICTICIFLQIVIPCVVLYNTINEQQFDPNIHDTPLKVLKNMFCVTDTRAFCGGLRLTSAIVVCIQILYVIKVNPDATLAFQRACGSGGFGASETFSRCKAVREEVYEKNNDRPWQLFGYLVDFYMNTLYVYIIFLINLYNILNQASPTNVILNALALEFVFTIDEDYARMAWWDFSKRWLKAGMIEVYIQSQFEYRALIDNRLFSKMYKIDSWEIDRVAQKKGTLLYDCDVSCKDRINLKYMSHTETFEYFCKCEAAKLQGDGDYDEFFKPSTTFGTPENFFIKFNRLREDESIYKAVKHQFIEFLGGTEKLSKKEIKEVVSKDGFGIFRRMQYFQTWSRWSKVLFLADIPRVEALFEKNKFGQFIVKKEFESVKTRDKGRPFFNFFPQVRDPEKSFEKRRMDVLSFVRVKENVRFAYYQREYLRVLGKAINGLLEWCTFFVQVGFPVFNYFLFAFALYCTRSEIIYRLSKANEGFYRCDCKEITVFNLSFDEDFNCSQAALLSSLLLCWDEQRGIVDCELAHSDILKVFDYYGKNITLPYINCEAYHSMLLETKYDVKEFNDNYVVGNVTERVFEEFKEICEDYPNEYLY